MQWDMTMEHEIYADEKAHRIDNLCDLFDAFFDVQKEFGSQCQEGYAVDVFELPEVGEDFSYSKFLKDSLLAYLDIYLEHNFKAYRELMDRRSKDKISVVPTGKRPVEEFLSNMVPNNRYIPKGDIGGNQKTSLEQRVEKYYEAYELELKTVVNELAKISDTNVECFNVKYNEVASDYNGIITGTYLGIVFDVEAFVCGRYFFLVAYGTSE